MIKFFKRLFGKSTEVPDEPVNIYQKLIDTLGGENEITNLKFIPAKARSVQLAMFSEDLTELSECLIESTTIVAKRRYMSNKIKDKVLKLRQQSLDTYITDGTELIHPIDWLNIHTHFIIKLADAILTMDNADREYYQRYTTFIVEDILTLVEAVRKSSR